MFGIKIFNIKRNEIRYIYKFTEKSFNHDLSITKISKMKLSTCRLLSFTKLKSTLNFGGGWNYQIIYVRD